MGIRIIHATFENIPLPNFIMGNIFEQKPMLEIVVHNEHAIKSLMRFLIRPCGLWNLVWRMNREDQINFSIPNEIRVKHVFFFKNKRGNSFVIAT